MLRTIFLLLLLCLSFAGGTMTVSAQQAADDYKQAKLDYLNAVVCMASYGDYNGRFSRYELTNLGWQVFPFTDGVAGTDAKFFTIKGAEGSPDSDLYIIAITGTETKQDVLLDLNFHKVFFGGSTPEEFSEATKRKGLTSKDPMVHSGFNRYANAAFYGQTDDGETYGVYLARLLKENKKKKIYLTGHSLGGAAATIQAARLISMGVDPNQIEVVSFGAPAVGNEAFADIYGSQINLRRIVLRGDPIQGALQGITGGYTQFGDKVVWQRHQNLNKFKHEIAVYLDSAMRNYYDAKAVISPADGEEFAMQKIGEDMVYISPPKLNLDKVTNEDKAYIEQILMDAYRWSTHGFILSEDAARGSLQDEMEKAKAKGCQWLLLTNVESQLLRSERNSFYIAVEDMFYNVYTGEWKASFNSARSSHDSTPLQVVLNGALQVKKEREDFLANN